MKKIILILAAMMTFAACTKEGDVIYQTDPADAPSAKPLVTATGSQWSPGIGGGYWSTCGNITITNGVTSVTAIKGGGSPCSIGRANSGSCGTVTIGGKVYADGISTSPYTYKP